VSPASERREKLRATAAERGLDAVLVTNLLNVRYLTGFTGSNGALRVRADGADLFGTDGRYTTQAAARLCLARPEIFAVQFRALARAAVRGNLKVMFPMVTSAEELEAGRKLFTEVVEDLRTRGIAAMLPELGIMVEVPAAALAIATFKAAFFSIGSNDLAQYVLACDRTNGALAPLMDPLHPAVLELIARTSEHGRRVGAGVSLCGDMASDARCVSALLNCGLRELSVNASTLAQIKHTIERLSSGGGLD